MNIFESIAAVQSDVDFIGKDKQVQSGGSYKYRGVDQVLNTLHPLFAKHKVFAVPEVETILEREERTTQKGGKVLYQVLKVKYTFYAEDGTSVTATVIGEAMDSGDKVSNKCMSVAYKYACFQVLSIPTEETASDPDDENEPLAEKRRVQSPQKKPRAERLNEIIEGTNVTRDSVEEWLSRQFGAPTTIDDLDEEEFETALKAVKKKAGK